MFNRFVKQKQPTPESMIAAQKWREEHPNESLWINDNHLSYDFARSLAQQLLANGFLSPRQIKAIQRCITQAAERKKSTNANKVTLASNASTILTCLRTALANGLKNPRLRTQNIDFTLAKAHSRNAGYVYVKANDSTYLGKINPDGEFHPARECTDAMCLELQSIAQDPLQAAVRFGRMSGSCSCCGKRLDNPESVRLGIGPVCRKKYFSFMDVF